MPNTAKDAAAGAKKSLSPKTSAIDKSRNDGTNAGDGESGPWVASVKSALKTAALPGEEHGFDDEARCEAAQVVARAAQRRQTGGPSIILEPMAAAGRRRRMRLVVVNDDMPFLVDSTAGIVGAHNIIVDRVIHPVISVERDAQGVLQGIDCEPCEDHKPAKGMIRESIIYMEMDRADARIRKALVADLNAGLRDVRAAVADWPAMQEVLVADAKRISGEGAALLEWFLDRNLTQIGHERRTRDNRQVDPLGMSKTSVHPLLARETIDAAFKWFDDGGEAPLIIKSNLVSNVHRRVLIDLIIVPLGKAQSQRTDELSIHAGMWTSAAMSAPPSDVPVLRARLSNVMKRFNFDPAGHAGKALAHALTALPHDLMVALEADKTEHLAMTAMSLSDRPRPKLFLVQGALGRHLFAFVWLPRDEVSTGRRVAIETMLTSAAKASVISWNIVLEDGEAAMLRYTLDLRDGGIVPDAPTLDDRLKAMVRGWLPGVEEELGELGEVSRAAALTRKYAEIFPANYRTSYGSDEAARDILRLRDVTRLSPRTVRLYRRKGDRAKQVRLKVYNISGSMPLSDAVPALEDFGFKVIEEVPTALADRQHGYIHDFLLERDAEEDSQGLLARADVIEPMVSAVLTGMAEGDVFNRLAIDAGLASREIVWLRAWFRYLRQTGMAYGMDTVVDALRNAPAVTRGLVGLFSAMHHPEDASTERAAACTKAIDAALVNVTAIDDDRILRTLKALIEATLRTNAFAPAAREALAFKIDSAGVPGLPKPLPWREIWVYSPRVEGIHLRAGPVARGGLRWSDRRDDFRTEVLGLMRPPRVKNAVIVPTGAKGGFYPKQLPNPQDDRDGWIAEGTEAYRIFIRTLLSITDNIEANEVLHPNCVVTRDGDDPYFVVAADKGTSTFSDVANAIALERNFWLGDAFASGGSHGYDHKAMGITAKGAWLSVQRHFAEMGIDVQSGAVRVAGCGDMSGDVFGNGMLLSKSIKLVAAFDHRHIFLDPDPDPAKSWAERRRMFDLPRSSWEDYDAKLISSGGGIHSRQSKSLALTPQVKEMLGLEVDEIEPTALISAILKAEVDLLWFGGIGTYIKASTQNHVEVGDPANDRLRVDGNEVRAKVIGEGANLGVTQDGRIEFAVNGGRINTDFIDNSAGVDCSDNEVNIKIALNREMLERRLSFDARNELLVAMTDDVSAIVLEDNRLQALALSIAERGGGEALPSNVRLIEIFESTGRLDRKVEGLAPSDVLLRRGQDDQGLTRPELAVLLSTAKLALQDAIEASRLPDDPTLQSELREAFPPEMRDRFPGAIDDHRLRREIIATRIANRIVNRMGIIHPFELAEEEGCAVADVAAMFVAAERLFDMEAIWDGLDTAAIDEDTRLALFTQAANACASQVADLLRTAPGVQKPGRLVARLKPGVERLLGGVDALLSDVVRQQWAALSTRLAAAGTSDAVIEPVVRLFKADGAIGLAALSERLGVEEIAATKAFSHLGAALGLDWAQTMAAKMAPSDPWDRLLTKGLARDFQQMRLEFLARAENGELERHVAAWIDEHAARVAQFRDVIDRAKRSPMPTSAMLAQIAAQARSLLAR